MELEFLETNFNPASGTQNVTYTVGTAPCQETQVHTITVIANVNPAWTNPGSICVNAGNINLNSLITGTCWWILEWNRSNWNQF